MRSIAILAVLAACGGTGSSSPDAPLDGEVPRETVMDTKTLLVGEILEATLTGGPGDRATITLSAPLPALDWNIHGHAGGATQTVKEELGIMTARYTFSPPAEATWFLLVRNQDAAPMTIDVTIDLFGDIAWSGWQ